MTLSNAQVLSQEGSPYNRTAAEITAGVTPTNYGYPPGDVRRYGVVGDGTTDDSTALQSAVNANKGLLVYVPYGLTPLIAGVTMIGSTYDRTIIRVDGELKLKADGGSTNYQGVWVGLALESTTDVQFWGNWNGNRAAMSANEHIYCISIAGTTNTRVPVANFREIRGDGIYITQVLYSSNSANPVNVMIGQIKGYNSADDGRNLVSVISCSRISIDAIDSYQIGGFNSGSAPGGLDFEPNQTFQSITDVTVGTVNVTTNGLTGLSFSGQAITNDATRDWNIQRVVVGSVNIVKTGSGSHACTIRRVRDLDIGTWKILGNGTCDCLEIDFADRINIQLADLKGGSIGVRVGDADFVNDSRIGLHIKDYITKGLRVAGCARTLFKGRIYGATNSTNTFAIQALSLSRGLTHTGVIFEIDAPFDGNNIRAYRNQTADTVAYGAGTCARNCDWSGYASFAVQCDGQIPTYNITGRNTANGLTAAPANGAWAQFDRVEFMQTAGTTSPGAICITGGSPGTWKARGNVAA